MTLGSRLASDVNRLVVPAAQLPSLEMATEQPGLYLGHQESHCLLILWRCWILTEWSSILLSPGLSTWRGRLTTSGDRRGLGNPPLWISILLTHIGAGFFQRDIPVLQRWYFDATFKVVKSPFTQFFSVHAFIKSGRSLKQIPLAFVLMSGQHTTDSAVVCCGLFHITQVCRAFMALPLLPAATWGKCSRPSTETLLMRCRNCRIWPTTSGPSGLRRQFLGPRTGASSGSMCDQQRCGRVALPAQPQGGKVNLPFCKESKLISELKCSWRTKPETSATEPSRSQRGWRSCGVIIQ